MGDQMKGVRVAIPDDLIDEVDALVGRHRRSVFIVDAVREKVERERLRKVAREMAGSLKDANVPGWETPEAASGWVRTLRAESDDRVRRNETHLR